jgi:hypothetical protein
MYIFLNNILFIDEWLCVSDGDLFPPRMFMVSVLDTINGVIYHIGGTGVVEYSDVWIYSLATGIV